MESNLVKDVMVKIFLAFCVAYTVMKFVATVMEHIPVVKEGKCAATPNLPFVLRIDKNHIMGGFSEITAWSRTELGIIEEKDVVPFQTLEKLNLEEVECPNF